MRMSRAARRSLQEHQVQEEGQGSLLKNCVDFSKALMNLLRFCEGGRWIGRSIPINRERKRSLVKKEKKSYFSE